MESKCVPTLATWKFSVRSVSTISSRLPAAPLNPRASACWLLDERNPSRKPLNVILFMLQRKRLGRFNCHYTFPFPSMEKHAGDGREHASLDRLLSTLDSLLTPRLDCAHSAWYADPPFGGDPPSRRARTSTSEGGERGARRKTTCPQNEQIHFLYSATKIKSTIHLIARISP